MIVGVHHTGIATTDLGRLTRFYVEQLGFERAFTFDWEAGERPLADQLMRLEGTGCTIELLRHGDSFVELFQFKAPVPQGAARAREVNEPGYTHICLLVRDIEAEHRRLEAAGVDFHSPPQDRGIHKVAYMRDPDGNVIELLEIVARDHPFGPRDRAGTR